MTHEYIYDSLTQKYATLRDRSTDAADTIWRERRKKWKEQLKAIPAVARRRKQEHKLYFRSQYKEGKFYAKDTLRACYLAYAFLRNQPFEVCEKKYDHNAWLSSLTFDRAIKALDEGKLAETI